ncbi:MAG: phosphoribosylformylglycinamidine synthase subunit PurL [Vampirovibrionales bacterium]
MMMMTTAAVMDALSVQPSASCSADEALHAQLSALNIRPNEYQLICEGLQRRPNFTELCMFSALWSEHCSYKHSKHLLKTLPTEGKHVVCGPGENAGIIDVGHGIHVSFKVESHNHPTYVEPFQGAATGVGGILRDIITMNARPVACLNALRFGHIEATNSHPTTAEHAKANKRRLAGAVAGIAHYGNCMGIPTIAGDTFLHPSYDGNPLVNAMAIGVMQPTGMMAAGAKGVGNPVLYVGSPTGRDGMGGASFASKALDDNKKQARPAVQTGDPYAEKTMMEACLEAFATGLVLAAQDMGAAGLTCATAEMAAKGNVGMTLNLDLVPAREAGMEAWEYLSSESQERMFMVLPKGQEEPVLAIFKRWRVPAVVVGEVIAEERIIVSHHGQIVVDVPSKLLTDGAPQYNPHPHATEAPEAMERRQRLATEGLPHLTPNALPSALMHLINHPNLQRKTPIYQQYDRHVRNNTLLTGDHHSAGVIQLRTANNEVTPLALATALEGNPVQVALNPRIGTQGVVAQAVRNVACTGAVPLASTNNLNFGNPEQEAVAFQLRTAVQGMGESCKALKVPVTGGNVSLYNTNGTQAIQPSPTVGVVGVIHDKTTLLSPCFKQAGHRVALLGRFAPTVGGSVYQGQHAQGNHWGEPPSVCLATEARLVACISQALAPQRLLASCDSVSLGGLLPTLLACCVLNEDSALGASVQLEGLQSAVASVNSAHALATLCFGETHGSYLISYAPEQEASIQEALHQHQLASLWIPLGEVTDQASLQVEYQADQWHIALPSQLPVLPL